jgi:SET domain-containing protein
LYAHLTTRMEAFFEIRLLPIKGRCVFAKQDFARESILERTPIILLPQEDWQIIERTCLHNYAFGWGPDQDQAAIALGIGSLFNHSYEPNAFYRKNHKEQTIEFIALRDIRSGEEITVNYSGHPYGKKPMWFETA